MRIISIMILVFLLAAFSIGIASQDLEDTQIDYSIDKASSAIDNISLEAPEYSEVPNAKGIYKILESGVKFVGVLGIETMRTGVHFGKDNPEYFTPEFIIKVIKLIVILTIVSLLIKPVFYILIFLVMGIMWFVDKIKKRKENKK